jgi:predicted DNA-binding transcriptional regulator AlpA
MPASLPSEPRFVRTKPAADRCGVSESNLNKRRVRGQPPPFIKLGKTVVYDTRDLDEWLTSSGASRPPSYPHRLRRLCDAIPP